MGMGFFLSTMAGLATMFGMIPILFKIKNEDKVIASSLAFAAGVMLCVSITDLIPESFLMLRNYHFGLLLPCFVFLSLMLGVILTFFVEKGMHLKSEASSLYQVGVISMLAIILHNIPEGCSCYVSCWKDNIGLNLKFKNYQDNLYYYFDSLFDFYKHYFNSSSIICFILSISGKNKFVPCFFSANNELKFSNISSFKLSATLTGAPLIVCG